LRLCFQNRWSRVARSTILWHSDMEGNHARK